MTIRFVSRIGKNVQNDTRYASALYRLGCIAAGHLERTKLINTVR